MILLAHRGYWKTAAEKNSESALRAAFDRGYGVETDLRDYCGRVVISHDVADSTAISLERFLSLYVESGRNTMLALNIKADGLCMEVRRAIEKFAVQEYFCFDMSVPDSLPYLNTGLKVFTRRSEFETGSSLDHRAHGFWLDAFDLPFVPGKDLSAALANGKVAALVSPELHGKPYLAAWAEWRAVLREHAPAAGRIMLCTDVPDEADQFFNRS